MSFEALKLFLHYLRINQLQDPIMVKIMEVKNTDTETYLKYEENSSNEHTMREEQLQSVNNEPVSLKKWLKATLTELERRIGNKFRRPDGHIS